MTGSSTARSTAIICINVALNLLVEESNERPYGCRRGCFISAGTPLRRWLVRCRTNQVVRRWSRLGDRNKRVLSRHVRGVRSTTFDIGPMSEVPHMPTSRGQRPAPAYIRLLSSSPTLCARGRVGLGRWRRSKTAVAVHDLAERSRSALVGTRATHLGHHPTLLVIGAPAPRYVGLVGVLKACQMHVRPARTWFAGRF